MNNQGPSKNMPERPHILFVCGRNQWRSPTAERIYRNDPRVEVRSAGVSEKSRHGISAGDVEWADLILVMESRYERRIQDMFRHISLPPIENLDIPDEYQYMDEELVGILESRVDYFIERLAGRDDLDKAA